MTHGFTRKWAYLTRTTPNIGTLLNPLEQTIRCRLIPKLTGREAPNDTERQLFALPTRFGGLNLPDPIATAGEQFTTSKSITKPLWIL